MSLDKEGLPLASLLLEIAESDIKSDDCRQALETFEKIHISNKNSHNLATMFSSRLASIGMSAYSAKLYPVAETAFRMLSEGGDTSAKNNYAYMVRRHEIVAPSSQDHVRALKLLHKGVQSKDAFSLVNTALVFALSLGDDDSWRLADNIMQHLSSFGGMLVESWWEEVAQSDDIEGYLVLFFLLKYNKIDSSSVGSQKSIAVRLKRELKGFPDWLASDALIENFDDVMECIDDQDFDTILEDFLSQLPCLRENVDEMLELISGWDLWQVYHKLLTDCRAMLTTEEVVKLKSDYKDKFSIPLPGDD